MTTLYIILFGAQVPVTLTGRTDWLTDGIPNAEVIRSDGRNFVLGSGRYGYHIQREMLVPRNQILLKETKNEDNRKAID